MVHNYVLNLLPGTITDIPISAIEADGPENPRTYFFPFAGSASDGPYMSRSRTLLLEDHAIVERLQAAGVGRDDPMPVAAGHGCGHH